MAMRRIGLVCGLVATAVTASWAIGAEAPAAGKAQALGAPERADPAAYAKKATWVETVIASREALLAAEAKDAAAGSFSPWRAVLSNRDKPLAFKVPLAGAKTLYLGARAMGKAQANLADCQLVNKEGTAVPFTFDKSMTKMTGKKSLRAPNKKDKLPAWMIEDTEFAVELNGEYDSLEATAFAAHGDGGDKVVFWVSPAPMLDREARAEADREAIWAAATRDFAAPADRTDMGTEKELWARDWKAGDFKDLAGRYAAACKTARGEAGKLASAAGGVEDLQKVRGLFAMGLRLELAQTMLREVDPAALRRAIADLTATFGPRYPKGAEYLQRLEAIEKSLPDIAKDLAKGDEASLKRAEEVLALQREALLANPLLDFDKVVVVKRGVNNLGLVNNWLSNSSVDKAGYDNEIDVLSPLGQGAALTTLYRPEAGRFVGDVDLNYDADRMLVSMPNANTWQVWELKANGTGLTQVTPDEPKDVESYDACYLPDGRIIFTSTANMQGVPCIGGGGHVANLALINPADKEKKIRMLAFEQDHDWCPTVMNDGMVMYLRWEYTDTPHYYTRIIAAMNPDGTNQKALYGSNSYWPNAIFFARPIPGHPSQFVGIVGGHHDVPRMGELVIFDPAKGHAEGDGVIQRIPGYGKKVEPIIKDGLAGGSWPLFLHPYPLSDKYYLVSRKVRQNGNEWGIYLVDVFDNMLLLKSVPGYALMEPLPLRKTTRPPVIPDKVNPERTDAIVYVVDIYRGPGLANVPRGTVKKLRVFTYTFGYRGMGGHDCFGVESGWDSKRILGTVPVEADGSVMFRAPANTPISVQPLDANGAALQLMRSWMTPMPGEFLSCIGCHESELDVTPNHQTAASQRPPREIEPWCGPARGMGFPREVQPVLDKFCVGCHDGKRKDMPNFADIKPSWRGFGESYHNLARYVRRPGPESDYHMLQPMEYHASTSELVQILNKGHHNVRLDAEAWQRLHTWMDLNTPYHATWAETRGGNVGKVGDRFREMQKLYANVETNPEAMPPMPTTRPAFIPPKPEAPELFAAPQVPGWPFDAAEAAQRQARLGGEAVKTIALGMTREWKDTITCKTTPPVPVELKLAHIPTGEFVIGDAAGDRDAKPMTRVRIDKPYWMATVEVTNAMYSLFDPRHDSRFVDMELKDQEVPGYHADLPDQPVIRVTWQEAMAFCEWLSHKTGMKFTLPTEAQWEWACRAGTGTPMWFGAVDADFGAFANFADVNVKKFALSGFRPQIQKDPSPYHAFIPKIETVDDKHQIQAPVGFYKANPWGLYDMHGNVAEWTRSLYKPYPYDEADGRNDLAAPGQRVVRGGSWFDRPKRGTSAFRLPYEAYQKVHNVGFRVVMEEGPAPVASSQ